VGLKSPEDQLEEFLARQLPWVRGTLQGDPPSSEAISALQLPGGFEILGKAQDEYLELLKRCPQKLREYRKLQKKLAVESALRYVPSLQPGAPRLDALAQEARELEQAGLSQPDIARSLNRRFPERKDRKGNKKPLTAGAVRKLLERRRDETPDKT
jgi:hypothetical protein